jgi:2'-hydroxyisoflavone reductase
MRLLVLGGSWFVGRAMVIEARRRRWEITVFNRGRSGNTPDGVRLVHGDRERGPDVTRLAATGPWDVVIDVAGSIPAVVRDSARLLADAVGRYVFISTISAYRDWPYQPVSEDSPLWDGDADYDPGTRTWDPDAYGPLKVGCEIALREKFGVDRLLIVRPHVVLGPDEYVGRLPWWLSRMRRGGQVIAPGPNRGIQPIDVRDLCRFVLDQVTHGVHGVFNVAAPVGRETYGDMLTACVDAVAGVADRPVELIWVDEDWLVDKGVVQWTELPLWRNAPAPWEMDVSRALRAGLASRPLAATVLDTWSWLRHGGQPVEHERSAQHGINAAKERQLLAEWSVRRGL